jgi:NADH-quinone oxidoreductase subunit C
MNERQSTLVDSIGSRFGDRLRRIASRCGELTYEVASADLVATCRQLREDAAFGFEQLVDLSGVDYLDYGRVEWNTQSATGTGFSRGVEKNRDREEGDSPLRGQSPTSDNGDSPLRDQEGDSPLRGQSPRFAVAYHLLSVATNRRLRLRAYCEAGEPPMLDSVIEVWRSADWYEREAFDLYGIVFRGHPDLRRILTDYGFVGHPFRKDFPLIGNVEVRYDPEKGRVVYEPVSIEPRTLVPRVIREDNRWEPALKDGPARG